MPFLFFAGNDNLSLVRGENIDENNEKVLKWQETDNGGRRKKHSYKIQDYLFKLGQFVQSYSIFVILTVLAFFCVCCIGLQYVRIESDIVKLWVSEGGRLNEELKYFETVQEKYGNASWRDYDTKHFVRDRFDPKLSQIREDEATNSNYQVLIQTAENPNESLLNKEGLLRHVDLLNYIVGLQITHFGVNWTLSDICFKPGALDINTDSIAFSLKPILERLVPCIWITPIDCFYEGSKPIGPHPPLRISDIPMGELIKIAVPDLPDDNTWSNLNPDEIVGILSKNFDLGTMENFFSRTGIGKGYLNRPCIDPLDPTCPKDSPNYFNVCPGIQRLTDHLALKNKTIDSILIIEEEKKEETSFFDIFGAFMGPASSKKKSNETQDDGKKCTKYRKSFLNWIKSDQDSAMKILGIDLMPKYPDYGNVMRKGCNGFAKDVMNWPVDMILGGVSDDGRNVSAEALQSVLLVASATEVYKRFVHTGKISNVSVFNETTGRTENLTTIWSPLMAREVVNAWQRKFTHDIYNHDFNFIKVKNGDYEEKVVHRTIHPLAAASISDILAEYCDFNYQIIFLGYLLMLIYAVYSQMRFESCCLLSSGSAVTLALAGVLTVTFASISGLGFVTWFGVEFNAATTQIIPFLTLGIGVDNMFMLLHNYPHVVKNNKRDEIGMLMKETGMSILLTSVNNILSFMTGTILPIPALKSFCTQSSVLLTFNLIAIMTVYPAIISIDLRRRKAGKRDICCCLNANEEPSDSDAYETYGFDLGIPLSPPVSGKPQYHGLISVSKDDDEEHNEVRPWSLHALLRNYYVPLITQPVVKAIIVIGCLCLFISGAFEIRRSTIGLELSDVLPEHTAPAAFLKARDEYFSFYPMFVVIKGEGLDFAQRQTEIEHLRNEIARSRFIIKLDNGEPSERYWLALFKEWLIGLQSRLDDAKSAGILDNFDKNNHTKSPELRIAYSLACSYGDKYDCSRAGKIKLVDESGTINTEGFYNYLYGWHEYESMFYTVSQASFYPPLKKLRQGSPDKYRYFIPPAPKPIYSQIPFYLTGLKDTAIIVEMIKEIRAISENYTSAGVPNYPSGIAFTFWEQYLDLNWNLVKAIGVISIAVFIVVSVMLFSPWAAACILLILLMMTVELAGFLGFCKIKLNPVSAVSLITAVGIGVEFTAHVVFAFITSPGSRNERMAQAVDQVFVPVLHGALSTLLGIIMLGFSEFEFVVKYFFVIMSALIIIGLINGLMLLPVILSLFGPDSKIKTKPQKDEGYPSKCLVIRH